MIRIKEETERKVTNLERGFYRMFSQIIFESEVASTIILNIGTYLGVYKKNMDSKLNNDL